MDADIFPALEYEAISDVIETLDPCCSEIFSQLKTRTPSEVIENVVKLCDLGQIRNARMSAFRAAMDKVDQCLNHAAMLNDREKVTMTEVEIEVIKKADELYRSLKPKDMISRRCVKRMANDFLELLFFIAGRRIEFPTEMIKTFPNPTHHDSIIDGALHFPFDLSLCDSHGDDESNSNDSSECPVSLVSEETPDSKDDGGRFSDADEEGEECVREFDNERYAEIIADINDFISDNIQVEPRHSSSGNQHPISTSSETQNQSLIYGDNANDDKSEPIIENEYAVSSHPIIGNRPVTSVHLGYHEQQNAQYDPIGVITGRQATNPLGTERGQNKGDQVEATDMEHTTPSDVQHANLSSSQNTQMRYPSDPVYQAQPIDPHIVQDPRAPEAPAIVRHTREFITQSDYRQSYIVRGETRAVLPHRPKLVDKETFVTEEGIKLEMADRDAWVRWPLRGDSTRDREPGSEYAARIDSLEMYRRGAMSQDEVVMEAMRKLRIRNEEQDDEIRELRRRVSDLENSRPIIVTSAGTGSNDPNFAPPRVTTRPSAVFIKGFPPLL